MAETVRRDIAEWMLGIILAIVLFLGISETIRLIRLANDAVLPATAFFEPIQLEVPDFHVGENPVVFYDRVIHQDFVADWVTEVQLIQSDGSPTAVCTGGGTSIYQPEKALPEGGATIWWFVGEQCFLGAGTYRVVANWTIERPGVSGSVTTRLASNLFKVSS